VPVSLWRGKFLLRPCPGKKVALYRDWLVMLLCRPFFKHVILHWHAAGLGKWLETSAQMNSRVATYRLFHPVDLSIVLSKNVVADAESFYRGAFASSTMESPTLVRISSNRFCRAAKRDLPRAENGSTAKYPIPAN